MTLVFHQTRSRLAVHHSLWLYVLALVVFLVVALWA